MSDGEALYPLEVVLQGTPVTLQSKNVPRREASGKFGPGTKENSNRHAGLDPASTLFASLQRFEKVDPGSSPG